MSRNLLFAGLDLPTANKTLLAGQLSRWTQDRWHFDAYRNSSLLTLRNHSGGSTWADMQNENAKPNRAYRWTPEASPELIEYFETHVFPWSGSLCRITALKTLAGQSNHEHIDCSPAAVQSRQHKFRWVIQGQTENLYFLTAQGRVYAPKIETPFLMDGSWPHGMENHSPLEKITLCLGAPWTGADAYPQFNSFLSSEGLERPANQREFFEPKYLIQPEHA